MFMRISSGALVALLLLAGCGERTADADAVAAVEAETAAAKDDDGRIVCAAPGSNDFARVCTLDRVQSNDGLVLTLRQPDGGFHRVLVTDDGRGVIAADGAEAAKVQVIGDNRIEVAIGGARYQLPATVK